MRLLGRDIYWSEPQTEQRSLERVTDIGIAFSDAISQLTGQKDSSIPAVRRAVQFIADTVASLHMEQYFGAVRTDEQPKLLSQPNSFETYHDTMNKVMLSLLYRGNSFIWAPTRNSSGFITSIYVVNPDEVTVNWDSRQLYPVYEWRGTTMDLNEDFFHIAINKGPGDLKGMGPIEAHRAVLSGIKAEQNMARRLMEDEATPSGLLEVPWKVTKAEAEFVQDLWESKHQGRKRPGVLGGGIKFTPLTIDPVDAQFIEQRQFSVQEVARMFGLHGSFLLAPSSDSLTYACLTPDTPVLTEGLEYVPVGQLALGDKIVAFDEFPESQHDRRMFRTAEVTNNTRKIAPTYRIELEDGTVFRATPNHMWLARRGKGSSYEWVTTEQLFIDHNNPRGPHNRNRRPWLLNKVFDTWEADKSWDAGFLAGMFDGEGHISFAQPNRSAKTKGRQVIRLAQKHNEAWDQTQLSLKELGFEFGIYDYPERSDVAHLDIRGGVADLVRFLGSVRPPRLLARWLGQGGADSLGQLRTKESVGIKSIERSVDQEIVELSTSTGTFIANGYASHNTTESLFRMFLTATLRPTYLERIEQTFSLMLPLGYSARFNTDEILKADMQARYLAHQIAIQTGFKTVNEVRGEEGLGALVGGDELRQPTADPATTGANT